MRRVLIVEHEPQFASALDTNLRACRYEVTTAQNGMTALETARCAPPDAVLLGMNLPDLPGIEVIRGLRGWTSLPIIALSRQKESREKVATLDAGADDYVTKPFSMEELLARLRAVLRRPPLIADAETVDVAGYRINLAACTAVPASGTGEPLHFTPTEWRLLATLLRRPHRLVAGGRLLREVWGPQAEDRTHYLRVYMAALRRKLKPDPAHPRHLITEPGLGYRFDP